MKIDFDHWKGAQISDEIQNQQALDMKLSIIRALNPVFSKDGNQFCFLYGTLPNDCIIGFGNTANDAMNDFVNNFYNERAIGLHEKKTELHPLFNDALKSVKP
jgi:hypothetical protein